MCGPDSPSHISGFIRQRVTREEVILLRNSAQADVQIGSARLQTLHPCSSRITAEPGRDFSKPFGESLPRRSKQRFHLIIAFGSLFIYIECESNYCFSITWCLEDLQPLVPRHRQGTPGTAGRCCQLSAASYRGLNVLGVQRDPPFKRHLDES